MARRIVKLRETNDSVKSARTGGLRYVSDQMPGIRREKTEGGFCYRYATGKLVRDVAVLKRIKSLAIPPAWMDVWICPDARGHLQATGRDARGRKQPRYHSRWREVRDEAKYARMVAFAKALPRIRKRIKRDLRRPGLPREKVLATVVRLLDDSGNRGDMISILRPPRHTRLQRITSQIENLTQQDPARGAPSPSRGAFQSEI